MKVLELIETDEWDNVPVTLEYLRKKQLDACRQYKLEINKLAKSHPDNRVLQLWASPPPDSFVATISIQPSFGFHSGSSELHLKYPSLKAKWNKIRDAKKAYEAAGGTYE